MLTARTALRGAAASLALTLAATAVPAASASIPDAVSPQFSLNSNERAYFSDMIATLQKADKVVDFAVGIGGEDGNTFPLTDEDLDAAARNLEVGHVAGGKLVLPGTYDTFALVVDRENGEVVDGGSLIEEELAGPAATAVAARIGADLSQVATVAAEVQAEVNAAGSDWGQLVIIAQPHQYLSVALAGTDKPVYLYALEREGDAYVADFLSASVTEVTVPVPPVEEPGTRSFAGFLYGSDIVYAQTLAEVVVRNAEALSALDGEIYPLSPKNLRQATSGGEGIRYRKGVLTIRGNYDVHRFQVIRRTGELRELPSQHRQKLADPVADQIRWFAGPRLENLDMAVQFVSARYSTSAFVQVRGGALYIGLKGVDRPAFRYFLHYKNGYGLITYREGVVSVPVFDF